MFGISREGHLTLMEEFYFLINAVTRLILVEKSHMIRKLKVTYEVLYSRFMPGPSLLRDFRDRLLQDKAF